MNAELSFLVTQMKAWAVTCLSRTGKPNDTEAGRGTPGMAGVGMRAAAMRLLDQPVTPNDPAVWELLGGKLARGESLADPMGHSRPIYLLLAIHLQTQAASRTDSPGPMPLTMLNHLRQRTSLVCDALAIRPTIDLWLWQILCWHELLELTADSSKASDQARLAEALSWWLERHDGALHEPDIEQSLDFWTYREFCGMHALAHLHQAYPQAVKRSRLEAMARYHVENSQPDNTTNQPWGLPLLAMFDESRMLAQQQFHDVMTHAASSGSHRREREKTGWEMGRSIERGIEEGIEGRIEGGIEGGLLADAVVCLSRYFS